MDSTMDPLSQGGSCWGSFTDGLESVASEGGHYIGIAGTAIADTAKGVYDFVFQLLQSTGSFFAENSSSVWDKSSTFVVDNQDNLLIGIAALLIGIIGTVACAAIFCADDEP